MNKYTWKEAHSIVEKLNKYKHNGHCNWRLPTIHELFSLVDPTRVKPACKLPDTALARYWSSTPHAYSTYYAWSVDFYYGSAYGSYKTSNGYVRPVRSGPNGLEWSETL